MIINLFSIFDPSSLLGLNLNWIRILVFILCIPIAFWVNSPLKINLITLSSLFLIKEIKPLLEKRGGKILIFLSLFIFIFIANIIGLFPYIFTYSSHLRMTSTLSTPLWLSSLLYGWAWITIKMLRHIIPSNTTYILIPFISLIELTRRLIRPVTLAVRLATNIIAGHLLLTLIRTLCYTLFSNIKFVLIIPQVVLIILELSVSLVQAYVFFTLWLLYVAEVNQIKN
jgi:ATP synthase subunit 6